MKYKQEAWRTLKKQHNSEGPSGDGKQPTPWERYVYFILLLLTAVLIGYASYISYQHYINPKRVYGVWVEIGMPAHDTEIFTISKQGVMAESRYISSSFDFDGEKIQFYSGDTLYEYHIYGSDDERLRRVSGGEYQAVFVRKEYLHTILKPDEVGPGRRLIDVAEHFKE